MVNRYHNYCAYQVELWHNCNNSCNFCYLNKDRTTLDVQQRLDALYKTIRLVEGLSTAYDAFGLIGGEFFQGQLETKELKETFKKLICLLDNKLELGQLKQVWIAASLLDENQEDFYYCLGEVKNRKKFLICTSYDTNGRFKDFEQKQIWFNNIKKVKELGFSTHIQTILTSYFIEEALKTDILEKLKALSSIDFKLPTPAREHYLHILDGLTVEKYRTTLKNTMTDPGFFVQDRKEFFQFFSRLKEVFGPEKLEAFSSNEIRSKTLNLISQGIVLEDRWTEEAKENAPCGHPWDSYCYLDSNRCTRCDAQSLLED